jgi:hypothetical protein
MGLLSVVGKTAKVAKKGAQAATANKSECEGCGKALRSTRGNVCSKACAQFLAGSY